MRSEMKKCSIMYNAKMEFYQLRIPRLNSEGALYLYTISLGFKNHEEAELAATILLNADDKYFEFIQDIENLLQKVLPVVEILIGCDGNWNKL